jgi:hypothetical protein
MPPAVLRTIILALIACGISGAILFKMQSPRVRPPLQSPDSFVSHTRPNHSEKLHEIEADIARTMASVPMDTRFTAHPVAARSAAAGSTLATSSEEDLDLNDPTLRLPLARLALTTVGLDDFAELLWLHAINDSDIAADARRDLIEDLNQDGFADPKNPTHDDLPLIEARLALIDRFAPGAIDKTNSEAFAEARKDLLAMHTRLLPPQPAAPEDAPKPTP